VRVLSFAGALAPDSSKRLGRDVTALGDALDQLAASAEGQDANGVVVVSDGANNAGEDPVAAARRLALPVHAVLVGEAVGMDRAVTAVEASSDARVGRMTPVRVRVETNEPRGTPLTVTLRDETHELGHAAVIAPGSGAEATAEFRVMPVRPGLAVWTARVDSLAGELTLGNNQRQVAVQVAAGRLGVTIVSAGLNWDLTFVRRALLGDSSLLVTTWVRDREGWQHLEGGAHGAVGAAQIRGQAVVVLDGLSAAEVGPTSTGRWPRSCSTTPARCWRSAASHRDSGGCASARSARSSVSHSIRRPLRASARRCRRPRAATCWRGTTIARAAIARGATPHRSPRRFRSRAPRRTACSSAARRARRRCSSPVASGAVRCCW
jgi:hypothetical protein